MTILDQIFADKRVEVEGRMRHKPQVAIRQEAEETVPALNFIGALRAAGQAAQRAALWAYQLPALIAEVKCASPSRGLLAKEFDPLRLAKTYQANGAAAISVLTDEKYFKGHLAYLRQISLVTPRLPLLCKDFICDAYQIYEARAAGADAVLLIAAYLDPACLRDLHALTTELGMAALVEIHNSQELESVLAIQPALIGINNRDLNDFSVHLETTFALRSQVPSSVCLVAESGIYTADDVARLGQAGVDAVLVGEALVTAPDVGAAVRRLAGLEGER